MKKTSLVTSVPKFPLCVALGTNHILACEDYQFLLCIFALDLSWDQGTNIVTCFISCKKLYSFTHDFLFYVMIILWWQWDMCFECETLH
jgi:hypothetical protein